MSGVYSQRTLQAIVLPEYGKSPESTVFKKLTFLAKPSKTPNYFYTVLQIVNRLHSRSSTLYRPDNVVRIECK
jgi:hypothetical protein